jgi:hypothetical protein
VKHVVVRSQLVSEEVLVPLDLVTGNQEDRLILRTNARDVAALPRYYEGRSGNGPAARVDTSQVTQPPELRQPLEETLALAGTVELGPETKVRSQDGAEARLLGVGTEASTPGLVELRIGRGDTDVAEIPAGSIADLQDELILLDATGSEVAASARPADRKRVASRLEGLSRVGGLDGDTPEQKYGADFVEELGGEDAAEDAVHAVVVPEQAGGPVAAGGSARRRRTG